VLFAALHESGFGRFHSLTVKDNSSISRATSSGACVLCMLIWDVMGSAGCGVVWLKSQSVDGLTASKGIVAELPGTIGAQAGSVRSLISPICDLD
jgi:hypothetical protein